jgi:Tfp pilus assembly protein PilF
MLLHEEGGAEKFDEAEKMFERASRYTSLLQSWLVVSRCHGKDGGMDGTMVGLTRSIQLTHSLKAPGFNP